MLNLSETCSYLLTIFDMSKIANRQSAAFSKCNQLIPDTKQMQSLVAEVPYSPDCEGEVRGGGRQCTLVIQTAAARLTRLG